MTTHMARPRETRARNTLRAAAVLACIALLMLSTALPAGAQRQRPPSPQSQAYLSYSLGRLLEVSGGVSDALVQYRHAESLDPGHCEISTAVARALYALGNIEDALVKSGQALADCRDDLEATAIHAEILLVNGEADRVERLLREKAESADAPRELAILYAQSLLSQGKVEEGEEYLSERAAADSLDPDVASMLGRALLLLGDSEGAAIHLRRSTRLEPGDRMVKGMLARLLITLERPEEGVPLLEWIVERFRPVEPELVSLAAGYSMLDEPELAHAALDSAVANFGTSAAVMRARAAIYYAEGDLDGALESYEELIVEDPNEVSALNYVAYTLADEDRDLDRALDYALRAVELEADNPFLRDTLGWTYFRLGNLKEARRELDLAIELGGENPVILEHLGDVLMETGETDEAVEVWLQALERSPGLSTTIERLEAADADIPDDLRRDDEGGEE